MVFHDISGAAGYSGYMVDFWRRTYTDSRDDTCVSVSKFPTRNLKP